MVRFLIVAIFIWSGQSLADPVALDLKGASVSEFVELVFKRILRKDYVLGPGLLGPDPKITVSVGSIEPAAVLGLAVNVLGQYGIEVDASVPVIRIGKKLVEGDQGARVRGVEGNGAAGEVSRQGGVVGAVGGSKDGPAGLCDVADESQRVEVYRPRHRASEGLRDLVRFSGATVSDVKGDAVVFCGSAARLATIRDLLGRLDRAPGVVEVRGVIVEYADGSDSSFSVSGALQLLSGKLGIVLSAGQAAGNVLKITTGDFQALVTALDGDSRFRQLAQPRLRVVDGGKARVVVGSDFPVRGQVGVDKAGNAVTSVEYRQAGIVLDLAPEIFEDSIRMTISQQVSSVSVTSTSGIDSPTVNKREVSTSVSVRPGELVLLAGLDESNESGTSSGLSFLPKWLHGTRNAASRTQVFLLLEATKVGGGGGSGT